MVTAKKTFTRREVTELLEAAQRDCDAADARAHVAEARVTALAAALKAVLAVRPREFTKPETQAIYRQAMAVVEET